MTPPAPTQRPDQRIGRFKALASHPRALQHGMNVWPPFLFTGIRVERMGGPATGRIPAGVHDVVVVPWDYDPACRPLPWGKSARWVELSEPVLFIAVLRAEELTAQAKDKAADLAQQARTAAQASAEQAKRLADDVKAGKPRAIAVAGAAAAALAGLIVLFARRRH